MRLVLGHDAKDAASYVEAVEIQGSRIQEESKRGEEQRVMAIGGWKGREREREGDS